MIATTRVGVRNCHCTALVKSPGRCAGARNVASATERCIVLSRRRLQLMGADRRTYVRDVGRGVFDGGMI
jgi:hypothetical protein